MATSCRVEAVAAAAAREQLSATRPAAGGGGSASGTHLGSDGQFRQRPQLWWQRVPGHVRGHYRWQRGPASTYQDVVAVGRQRLASKVAVQEGAGAGRGKVVPARAEQGGAMKAAASCPGSRGCCPTARLQRCLPAPPRVTAYPPPPPVAPLPGCSIGAHPPLRPTLTFGASPPRE